MTILKDKIKEARVRNAPFVLLDGKTTNVYLDYRLIVGVRGPTKEEEEQGYKSFVFGEGDSMTFLNLHTPEQVLELIAAADELMKE